MQHTGGPHAGRFQAVVVPIEACVKRSSTARFADIEAEVLQLVARQEPLFVAGQRIAFAGSALLAQCLDSLVVCDLLPHAVQSADALLQAAVYQLSHEEPFLEDTATFEVGDVDGETPACEMTTLPNRMFHELWDSLIFEGTVKCDLLNYVETAMLFSDYGVNTNLITFNRSMVSMPPPPAAQGKGGARFGSPGVWGYHLQCKRAAGIQDCGIVRHRTPYHTTPHHTTPHHTTPHHTTPHHTTPHHTTPHHTTPHHTTPRHATPRHATPRHTTPHHTTPHHTTPDVLITDLAKFFDVIAQDIHPIVGARVGLGEADHLATHTEGFSYTLPLGPWQSHTLTQLLGTPQGTVQGVHAGATAALPFLRYMDIAYRSSAVEPFRFPGLMWVDDTIVLLERGDSHPIQGVLLDQRVYYQGILRVDVLDRKIQHGSTSDPRPLRSPTPAAVARHLGRAWVTSTPDQRREALAGAPEIQPSRVLRYMGTDIYLQGAPTAPRNLPEVRAELWTQLRPQRLSPDAAMMVLMAKLPSKLLPLASVYRPTAKVHAANDALMVRAYKHVTGISRHAHTDALWGPWEHGCQGLTRSEHSWQVAVVREWVRQGAWAKQEFRDSQAYYLQTHQALRGGCPAVLTPGQYTYHPKCPHLIATLQRVVDEVAMPMWMPGQCSGTTPILVRGPGGPRSAAAAAPAPRVEVYTTLYGAVAQVVVPPTVYETVQALGYHHLGDLYTENHQVLPERALKRRAPARKGIPGLRAWLARHAAVLVPLLREPTPRWQAAPKDWIPRAVPTYQAEVIVGGRAAKTTRMETIYHRGQPLRMTAALQDTMETAGWASEPRVCQQPPGTLPSDTRLHRLLVALLDIQVQVDAPLHAQLWGDHRQESLAQLQRTGVRAPTVVWATAPPTAAYWNWASASQAPLVTITSTLPPFPWIAIAPTAVARFQYPAECMAHKCPGHPHKGPLYYSLDTVGTVPAELHQALRTHLREHHGDMALLAPHGRATDPPRVLAPETRPGVWFHDLPALATLRGSVVAVDAGATQAGMAMAGVVQSGPGEYQAQVASGVGTSQEGEAMALLSYARRLATQQGVYWLVPDSEAAVGALRTYQEGGHCGDGIHHLYATVLGGQRLSPRSAINVVTTPSHWITDLNVRVDAATREPPEVDLTWLLRRPYSFIPPVPFRDQCQLSPTALSDWLQDRASIPAQAIYEARWGVNFMPGGGLPLDWFDHDQQRHITAHRMDNVPTMTVLAHRSSHRGTVLDTTCLLCGTQPETAPHLWACSAQSHEWGPARRRLAAWLDQKVGPRAAPVRHQLWEPTVLEQWAAALRTPSMQLAHLECTGPHSLGTEFLRHVVEESIRIWYAHAKARATLLKARLGPGSTMAWALQELRLHQQAEREGVQRELLE